MPESSHGTDAAVTVREAVRTLRERWWILLAAAVLAAAAAYAFTKLPWVEPRWRSSVLIQATGRLDYGNFLALEKELRPLAEQVRQLSVMRDVNTNLQTDLPPDVMLDRTRAEPITDSGQIRLDVDDSDPHRAEQVSLEIANVYTRQHNAAEQAKLREERVILSTLDRQNQAVLIWPQTRLLVAGAAVLGLVVAALVVLGMVYLDDSIRSANDVQQYLQLPLLGSIPRHRLSPVDSASLFPRSSGPHGAGNAEADVPTTALRS